MRAVYVAALVTAAIATLQSAVLFASAAEPAASLRRDVYLKQFPEQGTKVPENGRRVHIVLPQAGNQQPTSVRVNGQEGLNLDTSSSADLTYFDWFRAHRNNATGDLWLSFHSRNTDWFSQSASTPVSLNIEVASNSSTVAKVNLSCPEPAAAGIDVPYVSFRKNGSEAVVHVASTEASSIDTTHTISGLQFDGILIDGQVTPPLPITLPAGSRAIFRIALDKSKNIGDVWTLTVTTSSIPNYNAQTENAENITFGFGGRVPPERFPIMAWPESSDCPLPGANQTTSATAKKLGIDSIFYPGHSFQSKCGHDLVDEINSWSMAAPGSEASWFHAFTDTDTAKAVTPLALKNHVDCVFLGDEVDGDVDAKHLRKPLEQSLDAVSKVPAAVTYQGSKTNHNVGAFAGITDVQGGDAYAAACAPTMDPVINRLPLQYPFYYLNNVRENTKPLPFWGYSQLYSGGWSYQANHNEIIAQIAQTVLSGSKALMLFQSSQENFDKHDTSEISKVIRSIRAISEVLRTGVVNGLQFSLSEENNKNVMVGIIRNLDQVAVVVVNTHAHGYSNLLCHTQIVDRHWTFEDHTLDSITLDVDSAVGITNLTNWEEVVDGQAGPLEGDVKVTNDDVKHAVTIENIELDSQIPVRFFISDVQ